MQKIDFALYGHSETKFGESTTIITASEKSIWDGDGPYPHATEAETLELVAVEAADVGIELGIDYFDSNVDVQEEGLATDGSDGTTPVAFPDTSWLPFRMRVISGVPTGSLILRRVSDEVAKAIIVLGNNQTLMAVMMVPRNWACKVKRWYVDAGKGDDVTGSFYVRPFGETFQIKGRRRIYQGEGGDKYDEPPQFGEKTVFDLRASTSLGTNTIVPGGFTLRFRDLASRARPPKILGDLL